jgi:hypothetical protein
MGSIVSSIERATMIPPGGAGSCAITRSVLERILLDLDAGVPGAALRVAIGAAFVLGLRALRPGVSLAGSAVALAVVLFGLKAFAAVARRLVPATPAVRSRWEWRRQLARYYDSYQWRKLVWFGVGILVAAAASPGQGPELRLGVACLVSGALGELAWRRTGLGPKPSGRG